MDCQNHSWVRRPPGPGTTAHVAYSRASTCPTWAELPEPTGVTDQKSNMGTSWLQSTSFNLALLKFICGLP